MMQKTKAFYMFLVITGVDNEVTSIDDALLALRMTEDTLIWFYKNKSV